MTSISSVAPAISSPLPKPYDTPPGAEALHPSVATLNLVRSQVQALLMSCPSFHALPEENRRELARNMVKIAAYTAELIRDDWHQSLRLGQRPVIRQREVLQGPVTQAQSAADDFKPAAAGQVARVTRETLKAVAFPTFVADLIKGTFNAIIQSSIQQMEAYTQLLENVGKTVDGFMESNISDNQAMDWLAQTYPNHIKVQIDGDSAKAVPREGAEDRPQPDWRSDLNLSADVSLDESSIEETLLPAARRKLAQSRLQLLSTMVLMGMNRIVVTGGKIRATMGFHIDTTDRAHEERATDLDFRFAAKGGVNLGWWSVSASTSISYVSSTRADSDAELHLDTDLTGEVDIRFKSDYFPISRFADSNAIGRIQANTAVPEANTPVTNSPGETPSNGEVEPYKSSRSRRTPRQKPTLPPIGSPLPEPKLPVEPLPLDTPLVPKGSTEAGQKGKSAPTPSSKPAETKAASGVK